MLQLKVAKAEQEEIDFISAVKKKHQDCVYGVCVCVCVSWIYNSCFSSASDFNFYLSQIS